jgi:hypothetical protein
MTAFAETLIRDLADQDRLHRWQGETGEAPGWRVLDRTTARQLALLRADLLQVGAGLAALTSILNALASGAGDPATQTALTWLKPQMSPVGETAAARLLEVADLFDAMQAFHVLAARLTFARSLTDAMREGLTKADYQLAADAWQRSARSLLTLLDRMEPHLTSAGYGDGADHTATTLELLKRVAAGESPCLDRDGGLSARGWAERRSEKRMVTDRPIRLVSGSLAQTGRLVNISRHGLCIAIKTALRNGSVLQLSVDGDPRTFSASVQWCHGGRAGLEFERPLAIDDPLLRPA